MKLWPTPHGFSKDGKSNGPSGNELGSAVNKAEKMWPTPKAKPSGPDFAKLDRSSTGISLPTAVAMWPTPTTRDHKDGTAQSCANVPVNSLLGCEVHQHPAPVKGGSLNPDWVELLMGFPAGWTDLAVDDVVPEPLDPSKWADGSWEEGVPRVAVGVEKRVARLKCLGNAVVPQIPWLIGNMILESYDD